MKQSGYSTNCQLSEHLRDALDEDQLSRYNALKDIKDSRRLAAMLPAYLKRELGKIPKAPPFIPDLPARFPVWINRCNRKTLSYFNPNAGVNHG